MVEKKTFSPWWGILLLLFLFVLWGVWLYRHNNPQKESVTPISTLDLNPVTPHPTTYDEPVVDSWRIYNNDAYNFTINVPTQWSEQTYPNFQPDGGIFIAFSPDKLPCATCTYVHDGYLSIRVYNQKTNAQIYADYLQRIHNVGKMKEYQQVKLPVGTGVLFGNTIAVEHHGWIYEFSLDAQKGNADFTKAKLFQKIVLSLAFTDLSFNP